MGSLPLISVGYHLELRVAITFIVIIVLYQLSYIITSSMCILTTLNMVYNVTYSIGLTNYKPWYHVTNTKC